MHNLIIKLILAYHLLCVVVHLSDTQKIYIIHLYMQLRCNVFLGYHQKCHEVRITQQALDDDSTWVCYFCDQDMACPYVANADVLAQSLEDIDEQPRLVEKFKIKKVRMFK